MRKPWTKSRILRACAQIDARNWKNEQTVEAIRECGHPLAEAIAESLGVHSVFDEMVNAADDVFYDAEKAEVDAMLARRTAKEG